jgi:prolyl-tRNA synthetase
VLYDDRDAGPGEKLTDAELLGCPLRVVVGRRGLAEGVVEAGERASGEQHRLPVGEAAERALVLLQPRDG